MRRFLLLLLPVMVLTGWLAATLASGALSRSSLPDVDRPENGRIKQR